MADIKIPVQIKTPEDSNGERKNLYPHTSSDEVIDTYSGRTLTNTIHDILTTSEVQPTYPGCWFDTSD